MKPVQITKENYETEITNSSIPVLLEFHAPWCPTCRLFRPVMYQLAGEVKNVKIAAVNIDDAHCIADRYGITTIPATLFIVDGRVRETRIGYVRKDELLKLINS